MQKGNISAVRALLAHNAEVDLKNEGGITPLSLAAQLGYLDIVKTLACQKADLNRKERDEKSSLYLAAEGGYENIVRYLLSHDGPKAHKDDQNTNTGSFQGMTELWRAVEGKHWGVARLLIAHGASLGVKKNQGDSILTLMVLNDKGDSGVTNIAEFIGMLRADVNSADSTGRTPLSRAACYAYKGTVEYLLSAGADPAIADHHRCYR